MQAHNGWVVATIIICAVALGALVLFLNSQAQEVPTAEEVAAAINVPTAEEIVAAADIPTAEEVAGLIVIPETEVSIEDHKKKLAEELVFEELNTRYSRDDISNSLEDCSDVSVDRNDITSIVVKEKEIRIWGERAFVRMELKVYFNNYGDEAESARIDITASVTDLDRDDNYADAEAVILSVGDSYSCSTE